MAWLDVNLDIVQNDQLTTKLNDDGSIEQNCIQVYGALSDTITYTPVDAMSANDGTTAVPTLGAYYSIAGTDYWLCNNLIPRRDPKSPLHWYIQANFYRKLAIQPEGED